MCSDYAYNSRKDDYYEPPEEIRGRWKPYMLAPVITKVGDNIVFKPMNFSLVPSWSKTPRVKFASHNTRIDGVETKPTWKIPFVKKHCLVPITYFIEPIYTGDFAGHMVAFERKDDKTLYVAGIYDTWVNTETGEYRDGFSMLTDDPIKFVADIGHDRGLKIVEPNRGIDWLESEGKPAKLLLDLLKNIEHVPELKVRVDRAMKSGWEKRV